MAMEDARHLAWGYVQYPPMTAFLGRVALELFGTSLVGFRFFAAVVQALALVLTGLMAKELGGGQWAQVVAALAGVPFCLGAGALMQYISFDYVCWVWVAYCMVRALGCRREVPEEVEKQQSEPTLASPETQEAGRNSAAGKTGEGEPNSTARNDRATSKDQGSKDTSLGGRGDARWWVGVGAGIGLGMLAKYTMGFLVVGVAAGVLFTNARKYLKSGWLWGGIVVAVGICLPNLFWQWQRNFISLEFLKFLHARDVAEGLTDWFLLGQLELTLLAFPLALMGIYFYLFAEEGKRYRVLGWMYAVPLVLFVFMRGRDYYLAPGYPMLYAAGCALIEKRWLEAREDKRAKKMGKSQSERGKDQKSGRAFGASHTERVGQPQDQLRADEQGERCSAYGSKNPPLYSRRHRGIVVAIWAALILDVVVAGAVALPIAPVGSAWWRFASRVDSVFPEEIGWPELVEAVSQVRERLPAEERVRVGILAGNYGEVGALNLYGQRFGLPWAISGVNSSWERGYGNPAPDVVIVVGYSREFLGREFASCVVAGHPWNRFGVANEETMEDPDIFVCRGLRGDWEEFWGRARRFA